MGGCCSSSTGAAKDRTPVYYYCPQTLDDGASVPLTAITSSVVSPGLFLDTNLDLSVPDAYPAPPALAPNNADLADSCMLPGKFGNCGTKIGHTQLSDSGSVAKEVIEDGNLKGAECKKEVASEQDAPQVANDEPSKLSEPHVLTSEEECPTCLEEYDLENPRIITKCDHHFHLSCILEWMERSETCPICDQIMIFDMGGEQ